jgi:hypothetical protein
MTLSDGSVKMLKIFGDVLANYAQKKREDNAMGDRILLSGTQVGMMIGILRTAKDFTQKVIDGDYKGYPDTPGTGNPAQLVASIKFMEADLHKALENQSIGQSENDLSEDVHDLINLFASWCCKTGD